MERKESFTGSSACVVCGRACDVARSIPAVTHYVEGVAYVDRGAPSICSIECVRLFVIARSSSESSSLQRFMLDHERLVGSDLLWSSVQFTDSEQCVDGASAPGLQRDEIETTACVTGTSIPDPDMDEIQRRVVERERRTVLEEGYYYRWLLRTGKTVPPLRGIQAYFDLLLEPATGSARSKKAKAAPKAGPPPAAPLRDASDAPLLIAPDESSVVAAYKYDQFGIC